MAQTRERTHLSDLLTSRRGAWVSLSIGLLVMIGLIGVFGGAKAPARNAQAPETSESTQAAELLEKFPGADQQTVLVVATRTDSGALTAPNTEALRALAPILATANEPVLSEDKKATVLVTPISVGESNTETADTVEALRTQLAEHTPKGIQLLVTGGPAFGADVAASFEGADFTLLLVTILIVAVLLIVTYRSPVLWLIPLAVVALADGLAGRVTAAAGALWDLQFDAGIISVLVFGAGTNYALLLISRYREELGTHEDHRQALSRAVRKTAPAILASNITVVLALLTLVLAISLGLSGLSRLVVGTAENRLDALVRFFHTRMKAAR